MGLLGISKELELRAYMNGKPHVILQWDKEKNVCRECKRKLGGHSKQRLHLRVENLKHSRFSMAELEPYHQLNSWQEWRVFFLWGSATVIGSTSQVGLTVKNPPANAGNVRDAGSIPGPGRSPGGWHGNPLQYSCLENPKDRADWKAAVHRVTQSLIWLKWLSTQALS